MATKEFPVEAGHIMTFARAVGDDNPVYDPTRSTEPVIAPPTFVQSSAQYDPDYPLRPKIGEVWFGSGRSPSGLMDAESKGSSSGGGNAGTLHAEQHYEYHKPLRAGTKMSVKTFPGKSWEKMGRRGGKLLFSEAITEYRDEQGELVVTARSIGVRTEKVIEQD